MEKQFNILRSNRVLILKLIESCTLNQLNKIPDGFKNNIAWNVAHLVVTHQLLCYKFSELPMHVSQEIVEKYKKGTAPEGDITQQEFDHIKSLFLQLVDVIEDDYQHSVFKTYQNYTTSVNVTLDSISDAIAFNNFHEGIHLGSIMALKKLI